MIVENWFSRFHPEFRGNCREDPTAAVPRDPLLAPILCCISCFWMLTTWPTPPPQQPEIDHQQDDDKLQQPQNRIEMVMLMMLITESHWNKLGMNFLE
ncbi:uncharacterized protein LOC135169256 isoform X4 [Diachasmimorpha longicaudata]|uniref:uncharacterized protein LOC135169256 isoform X4 n=1 Tax=Diachasmimorpha longicaudata TaxID=58733 RepID=UPI0030B8AA8D